MGSLTRRSPQSNCWNRFLAWCQKVILHTQCGPLDERCCIACSHLMTEFFSLISLTFHTSQTKLVMDAQHLQWGTEQNKQRKKRNVDDQVPTNSNLSSFASSIIWFSCHPNSNSYLIIRMSHNKQQN